MTLNQEQQAVVDSTASNVVCVCGPGTGKTRVLVARVAELLRRGADPKSIVAITYTNAAADEIAERIAQHGYRSGVATAALQDEDYEALASEVGRPNGKISYCGTLHGYALRLLERHGSEIGLTSKIVVMDEERAAAAFEEHAATLGHKGSKGDLATARAQCLGGEFHVERPHGMHLIARSWFANMLTTGAFDFDGILYWALRYLRGTPCGPITPLIHLLVDEAQDMADIDAQFYAALPCASRFVVADPDQSIFSFRGGNPTHVVGWFNDMNWTPYVLRGNYRSGEEICVTANLLIGHNSKRIVKQSISQTCFDGGIETWSGLPTAAHEQKILAEDIRKQNPKDCAVLLRTNALVDEYAKALESYGIPVARRQERERPRDWKLCKAALAAFANPGNDALVLEFIRLGQGDAVARNVRHEAAAKRLSVSQATTWWIVEDIKVHAVADMLVRFSVGPESVALAKAALDRSDTIADALLLLAEDERASVTTGDGVTVTTIHKAKGTEFETVYLPAFEQAIIPGREAIEEARRLAFVAVTRAKRRLVVSWVNERKPHKWATATAAEPSQFVKEMMGK